MPPQPVLRSAAFCLAHVPDLVRHGSKPRRELARDPGIAEALRAALRSDAQAVHYPPNQVFVGNLAAEKLAAIPRPWHAPSADGPAAACTSERLGPFGEILDQESFYALLASADVLDPPLVALGEAGAERFDARRRAHPLLRGDRALEATFARVPEAADPALALPLCVSGHPLGVLRRDERSEGRDDANLAPHHLLENLCAKASGAFALRTLLAREGAAPESLDYLISCGEEAVGDRYQRGGGGMAKAIGELCGCSRASGMDVKNFCAAPASALVTAAVLVRAGLFQRVAVVAGGSLAKLGMKLPAFLRQGLPILDDGIASLAFLVTGDDGESPWLRIDPGTVGLAPIAASTSEEAIYRSLLVEPLGALGLTIPEVDRFAPELHNAEIMELAGSGDVAQKNFRSIAAMAVLAGQLPRAELEAFVARIARPGFAPTQGHVPSGVVDLGHASRALREGTIRRAFVLSKASLFLGRLTDLYDGVSFLLEANPAAARRA